jgi:glutathione S-transferase
VICEYLEEAFPEPSLHPRDPWQKAQMRLLARISDIYLVMAMLPLFIMVARPPGEWEQDRIETQLAEIAHALDYLEEYIGTGGYAVGDSLSQADGALVPILLLVVEWLPIFRGPDLMADRPRLGAYWQSICRDSVCARLIHETRTALREQM